MARRRMFSLQIVDTDKFLEMPTSTQALYFHLGMRADDDGFVASPKRITSLCSCSADDLNLLAAKGFIYPFQSGVCVIVDWKENNYIPKDRYSPTRYLDEKQVFADAYPPCIQTVSNLETQVRLGKDRKRVRAQSAPSTPKEIPSGETVKRFTPPTVDDVATYCTERHNGVDAQRFVDYYTANGWKVGKNSMKDWRAAVRTWERNTQSAAAPQEVTTWLE